MNKGPKTQNWPPEPTQPRSLEFEKEVEKEFYALQEAGNLPVGENGEPLDFISFMEKAEEERSASGSTKHSGLSPRNRGKGSSKEASQQESTPVNEEVVRKIQELEKIQGDIVGRADRLYSSIDSSFKTVHPSKPLQDALDAYRSVVKKNLIRDRKSQEALAEAKSNPSEAALQTCSANVTNFVQHFAEEERVGKELLALLSQSEQAPSGPKNSTDRTPGELRKELRASIVEATLKESEEELGKRNASGTREGGTEEAYLNAVRDRYKHKGLLEKAAGDYIDTDARFESKDVKALRSQWIESQARLAGAQRESAARRLEATPSSAREALLKRLREKHGSYSPKADILERYERIVTRNSVVIEAEKAELTAKEEGLGQRDKKALERMFDGYKKLPPGFRVIGTSALLFGGAALAAGTPIGLAALGLGGASAGLRWAAEATNNPAAKNSLGFLAGLTSVTALSGILVQKAVEGSHWLFRTEKRAQETLDKTSDLGPLENARNLERVLKERRKAVSAKESVQRHGRIGRVLGSITGGFLFGSSVHGASQAEEVGGGQADAQDTKLIGNEESSAAENKSLTNEETTPEAYTSPTAPEGMLRTMEIQQGEGFNHLFSDLRTSEFTGSTPVGAYLMNSELTPTQLSDAIGAFDPETGESMIMQVGDKLVVDANENVWFVREGEEPRLVLENDPSAPNGVKVHELPPMPTSAPVTEAAAPLPAEEPVAVSTPSETGSVPSEPASASSGEGIEPVVVETERPLETPGVETVVVQPVEVESQPQDTEAPLPEPVLVEAEAQTENDVEAVESGNINAHGVDLDKPDVSVVDGKYFAHGGADNDANYALAVEYAEKLAATQPGTPVYYVEEQMTVLGGLEQTVRAVIFSPEGNYGNGLVVPYAVENGVPVPMPDIPDQNDYQPIPTRR